MLLSKVSSKLADKVDDSKKAKKGEKKETSVVEKVTNVDKTKKEKKTDDNKVVKLISALGKEKQQEKLQDQLEVVKEDQKVVITNFGREAKTSLKEAFGMGDKEEKPTSEPDKKEGGSWLTKLIGPGLAVLGAVGGFIASLLKGGWGEILVDFKKGNFKDAFQKMLGKIYDIFRPIIHSLPIIGPMFSFWDAFKAFNSGDVPEGINNLAQGIIGLVPFLPTPLKAAIFGGLDIVTQLLEPRDKEGNVEKTGPKGAGGNIMAAALKSIGKIFSKGFLKRLPVIGALFNFYDAYIDFKAGGAAGITKGILDVVAGIASFIPGWGTAISIGVDILNAFLFKTETTTDANGVKKTTVNTRDWVGKFASWIKPKLHYIPIIGPIMYAYDAYKAFKGGDWVGGLIATGQSIVGMVGGPLVGGALNIGINMLRNLFLTTETKTDESGNVSTKTVTNSFFKTLKDKILRAIVSWLPESILGVGIRSRVAKMLGVDMGTINDEPQQAPKDQQLPQKSDQQTDAPTQPVGDFIQAPDGKIIQPHADDTIYAMKQGGPLDNYFNNNIKIATENVAMLKNLSGIMKKQIDILNSVNNHLAGIKDNTETPPQTNIFKPSYSNNNYGMTNSLRLAQGVA